MTVQKAVKKIQAGFVNMLVKGHLKVEGIKDKCISDREREEEKDKDNYHSTDVRRTFQICSLILLGVLILYPENGLAAIADIADIKTLTKKVQDDSQNYLIPMVLNAAGIATAAFALISQRWTMLMFGAAYLIFVNVFFGFINGSFKVA
jgi:hypothetical protein